MEHSFYSHQGAWGEGVMWIGVGLFVLVGLVVLTLTALTVICCWRISSKAGYPGVMSLLILIPAGFFVWAMILAFGSWPIVRELQHARELHATAR